MAHQVNVFLADRPGRLERLTAVLADKGINIRAITIAGSEGFGVAKLLVDRPEEAHEALHREGFSAHLKDVLAVVMDDRPGGLHAVCAALGRKGVNIEDAYGFVVKDRELAVLVMEVEKVPEAESILREAGFTIMGDQELYGL
ncbi:MAG: ACT domain-containing protein [Candidatus Geothermincolales bacterium]